MQTHDNKGVLEEGAFASPAEYDEQLNQGIRLSGEDKSFFIDGRLEDLRGQLPEGFRPRRVLDFGCGTGDTTAALRRLFPSASVAGTDEERGALDAARASHGSAGVTFHGLGDLRTLDPFDLCYVNGVFHHIRPDERVAAATLIRDVLRPGGLFALFENNPWNIGTRIVMRRIPFDRDAQMLSPFETRRLMRDAGFQSYGRPRFLFYFPYALRALRWFEPALVGVPFGAQYWVMAVK